MKKIIGILVVVLVISIIGIGYFIINDKEIDFQENVNQVTEEEINDDNKIEEEKENRMKISVSDGSHNIIFELNDSIAASDLYNQLPLTVEAENFSSNEKIFYPSNELNIDETPRANDGGIGVLAYYEPWGDVVMFYDSFSSASGLYELGKAIENENQISNLSGKITIDKVEEME